MRFDPPWYRRARQELGVSEVPGAQHNRRIVEYFALAGHPNIADDETHWCSAFASAVFELEGIPSARTLWARNWARWGIPLRVPQIGAVCVFTRGEGGHVGFFAGEYSPDGSKVLILGGNQSNKVCYAWYPVDRLIAVRWPKDYRTEESNWVSETVKPEPPPLPPVERPAPAPVPVQAEPPAPAPAPIPVYEKESKLDALDRLRDQGSRIIRAADTIKKWLAGLTFTGVGIGSFEATSGQITLALVVAGLIVLAGAYLYLKAEKIIAARVDDDVRGLHIGRKWTSEQPTR